MKQIRLVAFTCKAKDLPSKLQEELKKAEKKMQESKRLA
jgi:hypothetical protein